MKQVIEFIPLIFFFIFYKMSPKTFEIMNHSITLGGIYTATGSLIITTTLVVMIEWIYYKTISKGQLITLAAVLIFGGLTLCFKNDLFIKWKAPVINWVFGLTFLLSAFIGKKPIIERLMSHAIQLPSSIWHKLNMSWAVFFMILGSLNLYVAFHFEAIWVDFKIFGSLGLTIFFTLVQVILLRKHIQPVK
ncbi:MAG: septation protein IspZ [Endozoicomonadaceae bacterium]|nr:septation protein IspZ [Endozoicomonadaceae bacterium]MBE8233394.1 septation protein IspZ [Endozoicomonadaceae bacterium]